MMVKLARFTALLLVGLFVASSFVAAEQIKLADGRFLQGEVVEVKEDGFTFKLNDTGGKVFLRWNQVEAGLKKRLLNEKDPDEGLDLTVTVEGARLELLDGTVYEGNITRTANGYRVVGRDNPRGKEIPERDVLDDGFVDGIRINATAVMSEEEALAEAERQREPLEQARQYYELARIADRFGLYARARDYTTQAYDAGPDAKLQSRLDEYAARLDSLIRQGAVLDALVAARKLVAKRLYQTALTALDDTKEQLNPTDEVLRKFDEVYAEIDEEFTVFVVSNWYKVMRSVARDQAKEKGGTVQSALVYVRAQMDSDIAHAIAIETGSEDDGNIVARFASRFELEAEGKIKLTWKRASFTEDGFYQIVDGHLANEGVAKPKPEPRQPRRNPNDDDRRRDDRRRDNPRRNNYIEPSDELGDAFGDLQENALQENAEEELERRKKEIEDLVRRAKEARDKRKREEDDESDTSGNGKQDISHLKPPKSYPSLADWYAEASATTKAKWLLAAYVKFSRSFDSPPENISNLTAREFSDWEVKYR